MRKGQIKLVENVKKIYGEQNNIVAFFENSEMSLNRLNSIYRILKCINKEELFCLNTDELQEIIVKINNHAEILYFALMYHVYYNDFFVFLLFVHLLVCSYNLEWLYEVSYVYLCLTQK